MPYSKHTTEQLIEELLQAKAELAEVQDQLDQAHRCLSAWQRFNATLEELNHSLRAQNRALIIEVHELTRQQKEKQDA